MIAVMVITSQAQVILLWAVEFECESISSYAKEDVTLTHGVRTVSLRVRLATSVRVRV